MGGTVGQGEGQDKRIQSCYVQLVLLLHFIFYIILPKIYNVFLIIHNISIQQFQSFFAPHSQATSPPWTAGRRGINPLYVNHHLRKCGGVCCVATGPADCWERFTE
jgi:hypothetical protein